VNLLPFPDETASSITETNSVSLSPGQRAVITFTPDRSSTRFRLGVVAITKEPETSYMIQMDGNVQFGPADIPPTDIDDLSLAWIPALLLEDEMRVIIEDLRSSGNARTYYVQPIGYEEPVQGGA